MLATVRTFWTDIVDADVTPAQYADAVSKGMTASSQDLRSNRAESRMIREATLDLVGTGEERVVHSKARGWVSKRAAV